MTNYALRHVSIWPWTQVKSSVGSWSRVNQTSVLGTGVLLIANGNGSREITYSVSLQEGIYKLILIYYKANNMSPMDVYFNSVLLQNLNLYDVSTLYNQVTEIANINVLESNNYDLKFVRSSGNDYLNLQMITFVRTGDLP